MRPNRQNPRGRGANWGSPGSDEVQQVLPAVVHLAQLALYLAGLALVAGPGQPLAQQV